MNDIKTKGKTSKQQKITPREITIEQSSGSSTSDTALAVARKEAQIATLAADTLGATARALIVRDDESATRAALFRSEVKGAHKKYKGMLDTITAPLRTAEKAARDLFRPGLEALATAEGIVNNKLSEYETALARERMRLVQEAAEKERKAREKLEAATTARQEAAANKALVNAASLAVEASVMKPQVQGLSFRSVPEGEVLDPLLIPREYLMPDEKALLAATKAADGDPGIPGWAGRIRRVPVQR